MKVKSSIMLLITAAIWGSSFVAQSVGMDYVGPFTFNAARCLVGSLALVPVILIMGKGKKENRGTLILGGTLCGVALFVASNLQQIGLQHTTVGKAGFITALYIVIVPVLGIFMNKRTGLVTWQSVAIAVVGLYFLCIKEGFSIGKGDILVLACAFAFSLHILIIDYFSPKTDGVSLSAIQFLVSGLLSAVFMLIFEVPKGASAMALWAPISKAWMPILYAGVLSCGVAYTLQIIAQKHIEPTIASMILSLESVIAVLSGWVLLGQSLSEREILGCILMALAIILAQLPQKKKEQTPVCTDR